MSSYGFFARLSAIESNADDLQASLDSLDAEKQDSLSNANVEGGQPIKVGSILNRIGTKDTTLTVETEGAIIKFAVDKTVMQEKLDQIDALPRRQHITISSCGYWRQARRYKGHWAHNRDRLRCR